ncbi:sugar phosphate nucleotidyltransferase [Tabrizicola aquatica]|uniref:sugar phosphate nucleotidyltransferase n=1 Tax=Tabrizicola aquatica TaxID=909926 RepID=UPI000CD0A8A8|nr:sugar phosphate nucleotidyltransferase [Tabrizicola aquatica]
MSVAGRAMPNTPVAILLAGGRGSRLHELTDNLAKPAVAFGRRNRIVDFTLENLRRSGLSEVLVATQYCADPLEDYLNRCWRPEFGTGLRLRRASGHGMAERCYAGTADAVWKNAAEIDALSPREVIVLSGDHVYAMDYQPMIAAHRAAGAAVTLAADVVPLSEARAFGCIEARADGRVTGFVEKPARPPAIDGEPDRALVSMGIYVFDWRWLRERLRRDAADPVSTHDFGHDILPAAVAEGEVQVVRGTAPDGGAFFWRDVGTLDAFRATWLAFDGAVPCPLPSVPPVPAARLVPALREASAALDDAGAVVPLAPALQDRTEVVDSVLMPGARVGEDCRLRGVILAPGTRLPDGLAVGHDPQEDALWFRVTPDGTVLVTPQMLARRALLQPGPVLLPGRPTLARSR